MAEHLTKDDVQRWLDEYVAAWKSSDPALISALFSAGAEYRYTPYQDAPVVGGEAIAASWMDEGRRDDPGTFEAAYTVVAVDGELAVATGTSRYFTDASQSKMEHEFHNAYLLRFDADRRCRAFTEYYMERELKD